MTNGERTGRRERAKAIGRAAYSLARTAKIEGFIEIDGHRHRLRTFSIGSLSITLYEAANPDPCDSDLSELRIHFAGKKVFQIEWSKDGSFRVRLFEVRDEWIAALRTLASAD